MISDARALLAGLLSGSGVPVHAYPPATLEPPAIVIIPGAPYLTGRHLRTGTGQIRLQAQLMTGQHAHEHLDSLLWSVLQELAAAGYPPDEIPPPVVNTDTGTLICRIPVTLDWKED